MFRICCFNRKLSSGLERSGLFRGFFRVLGCRLGSDLESRTAEERSRGRSRVRVFVARF